MTDQPEEPTEAQEKRYQCDIDTAIKRDTQESEKINQARAQQMASQTATDQQGGALYGMMPQLTPEFSLRAQCLNTAIQVLAQRAALDPDDLMKLAQRFYDFVTGAKPSGTVTAIREVPRG